MSRHGFNDAAWYKNSSFEALVRQIILRFSSSFVSVRVCQIPAINTTTYTTFYYHQQNLVLSNNGFHDCLKTPHRLHSSPLYCVAEQAHELAQTHDPNLIYHSTLTNLVDECRRRGFRAPNFQECSDRRGGRTAWSSVVEVDGCKHQARFWYDGDWVNNAREDAAEVALQRMGVVPSPPGPHARLFGSISV
ncbi:hypothetical protein E4T38_07601 [Aureobasidium subglaciale]|nr:hypothetical protein E4T38_07601 [Aureobasidium subglaciale]KAI5217039.1 hypothetical protein E4T40_07611 [Aureobasidium subglaciale]KAI5220419.1 hypothetical protein E4T41_07526 [Aureobasidium subglaciale]